MKNFTKKLGIGFAVASMLSLQTIQAQNNQFVPLPEATCLGVGTNISFSNYGEEYPFVDFFKMNQGWTSDTKSLKDIAFDKDGYPTKGDKVTTLIQLINVPNEMEFVIMWDGAASDVSINPLSVAGYEIKQGSFTQSSSGGSFKVSKVTDIIYISINNSQTTTDIANPMHIRNIRMIRSGFENTDYLAKPFNPEFLEQSQNFILLNAINSKAATLDSTTNMYWKDRVLPSHSSQTSRINGTTSMPAYEHLIQLANANSQADCWVNIPYAADENYVREMAKLYKNNLMQNIKIKVETGFEIWNESFLDQNNFFYSKSDNNAEKYLELVANTMKRNWSIWREVFNNDSDRIKRVYGAQSGYGVFDNAGGLYLSKLKKGDFDIIAIANFVAPANSQQYITANKNSITAVQMNEFLLKDWNDGSSWKVVDNFNRKVNTGISAYSKAANQFGAKLYVYAGDIEPLLQNNFPLAYLRDANMQQSSLNNVFTAVFDTLKKYGVEEFTFNRMNGVKNDANYATMGGTFTAAGSKGAGLETDAKLQIMKNYNVAQKCSTLTVVDATNMSEILTIYPNPTTGNFAIANIENSNNPMQIECFNSNGMKMFEKKINNNEVCDELNDAPAGLYHVNIYTNGKKTVKKIIKM